ncbi:hypothetical protein E8E14_012074 [Neopestalotiopsis sp. 37M]|nr:hypothetical protein E8E14_012074 [Neopestalotiopsis sp. 37M]
MDFNSGEKTMQRYAKDGGDLLIRGYEQYSKKGLPFSVFNYADTARPLAILPTKYLEEVRKASANELSFNVFLNKSQVSKEIGGPLISDRVIHIVRQDLNRSLNDLIQPLHQAVVKVTPRMIPSSQDWAPYKGVLLLLPLISRLMSRVLLGPELWDNDEWHQVCSTYFQAGFAATTQVRDAYPPWLRWTSRYLDKNVKTIHAVRRKGEAMINPVIGARLAEMNDGVFKDGIGWLVKSYLADGKPTDPDGIMQDTSFLLAASVPSTTNTTLSILLDLVDVDHADVLTEVRDEISNVYSKHGSWTRQSLASLRVLDSFMKESQRIHNVQYNTMQRMTLHEYVFKDGLRIPAGTPIVMPSRLLGLDPDLHANPEKFDARRWKRMREQGDATKFHFASLQDDMLPWGSGPHACPGRFLSQEIIKLILIHFVTTYDMKIPADDGHRPPDHPDHGTSNPNMMATLLFKER